MSATGAYSVLQQRKLADLTQKSKTVLYIFRAYQHRAKELSNFALGQIW